MTTRTQDEIMARINEGRSFLGFHVEVLIDYLDYEHARPLLTDEAKAKYDVETWPVKPAARDVILADMKTYIEEYGWPKVIDHRGISAGRTVEKMETWAWLLGDDALSAAIEGAGYAQYGAPKMAAICERLGWPIPDDEDVRRMIQGRSCGADYACGCGQ